ncbi:hypothetical protein FB567DRAFT_48529 [Paraphoma chrysanthemicola]|uniref:Uncharacterized protein n=1 Tax=Paraphoma chrysanthemicola TaxID=798071 RepID=A0A8K0RLN4_9PLEO|nr:hypothetical protein FB567DRAFT_48529 [Paraphoma chrysanthemicola]
MADPAQLNQTPDHASRHDQRADICHHALEAEGRAESSARTSENEQHAESSDCASDNEQQESTRKLIQVYSISRPVQEKKEKRGRGRSWKTSSTRLDNLRHEHSTRKLRALRHRTRALWLLVLYFPFLVVPWVLTCILSRRPVIARSYVNQQGFSKADIISI